VVGAARQTSWLSPASGWLSPASGWLSPASGRPQAGD